MREFKFRAWITRDKAHKGVMDYNPFLTNSLSGLGLLSGGDSSDILMQFTGLKDRYGVEIYEDDLMRARWNDEEKLFRVVCKKCGFMLEPIKQEENVWSIWLYHAIEECPYKQAEVIGNIYQNPELLG